MLVLHSRQTGQSDVATRLLTERDHACTESCVHQAFRVGNHCFPSLSTHSVQLWSTFCRRSPHSLQLTFHVENCSIGSDRINTCACMRPDASLHFSFTDNNAGRQCPQTQGRCDSPEGAIKACRQTPNAGLIPHSLPAVPESDARSLASKFCA